MAGSPEDVPPLSRRMTQEVDSGVDHRWPAVYRSVAITWTTVKY